MTKKTDIESIPRERWEVEKAAEEIRCYLIRLCEDYDRGNTFAIVLVAVILRTLLKTKGRSISVFEQLGWHTNLFVDSRSPEGGFSFWEIGDNVSNHTFLMQKEVYGGLLKKKVCNTPEGLKFDFAPLLDVNRRSKQISFIDWYGGDKDEDKEKNKVLKVGEYKFTREDCIENVADKDGGAHFDPTIPIDYYALRQPTSLKIIVDGQVARFNQNPVYVSVRQIAWEVLDSWGECEAIDKR